jgi:hypothetical protein
MSTRKAIQGTVIRSNSTAAQIAKRQSNAIAQYRKDYLFAIENQTGADKAERARMWGAMIYATKPVITHYHMDLDERTGKVNRVPSIDYVPDWKMREHALRHIDELEESIIDQRRGVGKVQLNLIKDSENLTINNFK